MWPCGGAWLIEMYAGVRECVYHRVSNHQFVVFFFYSGKCVLFLSPGELTSTINVELTFVRWNNEWWHKLYFSVLHFQMSLLATPPLINNNCNSHSFSKMPTKGLRRKLKTTTLTACSYIKFIVFGETIDLWCGSKTAGACAQCIFMSILKYVNHIDSGHHVSTENIDCGFSTSFCVAPKP